MRNRRPFAAPRGCEEIAKPRHPSCYRFAQETDLGERTSGPQSLDVLVRRPMRRDATVVRPEVGRLRTRGPLSAFIPISSQPLRVTGGGVDLPASWRTSKSEFSDRATSANRSRAAPRAWDIR